ncbi:HDOD domain-containing protein [bacterium]|nr:HDOD domain-containing protein [bacterium]
MSNPMDVLFEETFRIPTLPSIFVEIRELIGNPRHSMADIAALIDKDAGLTIRLLRLANSAYYGLRNEVDTVKRALVCIGTRELQNMVFCTSVVKMFHGIPEELINMTLFWKHSVGCGLMAKSLATYIPSINPDQMFIAGLLHDVGRLLIWKQLPKKSSQILLHAQSQAMILQHAEQQYLGYDHCDVAARLLQMWNIPEIISESVTYHHQPQESKKYFKETSIIHLADIIVHALELGQSGERFVPPLNPESWEALGLKSTMFIPMIRQMNAQYQEVIRSILQETPYG